MRIIPIAVFLFFALNCQNAAAQNPSRSFEELERQMLELQRRMMEQLQNSPFDDRGFATPQWDTTFFFRFDTTFENGGMSRFFHFSPFGADSTMQDGFGDFGRMFDRFFDRGGFFDVPESGDGEFPSDDGAPGTTEDELLPEERLRRKDGNDKPEKSDTRPKAADPRPDPRIKTIRI